MQPVYKNIINRHRNPIGIFLRIPNTILFGFGLWYHLPSIISIGILGELSFWLVIPPVKKSPSLIDKAIEEELRWLFSPTGPTKILSIVFLLTAAIVILSGLWTHLSLLLIIGTVCMVEFKYSMSYIARRNVLPSEIASFWNSKL